jgi:4-alpha-glucanotransferase
MLTARAEECLPRGPGVLVGIARERLARMDHTGAGTAADVSSWPALRDLAQRCGVGTDYWDWQGRHTTVSVDTVAAVLAVLGIDASSEESVARAHQELDDRPWRRLLPPVVVMRQGTTGSVLAHVTHGAPLHVEVRTEDGAVVDAVQTEHNVAPHDLGGSLVGEARFELPADLPLGYHSLVATSGEERADALLVVAPDRLDLPPVVDRQVWGLTAQLYAVRSRASWGVGDFADLAGLADWGAGLGAEFVLVNPLHAAEPVPPLEPSPYLPTSRRFLNPLYVRVEEIPETRGLATTPQVIVERLATAARGTEEDELIDRDTVWRAKLDALELVFAAPRSRPRQEGLDAFLAEQGEPLRQFALWCALDELFTGTDGPGTPWPEWARDPSSPAVAELAEDLDDRVEFYAWLQWVADEQLGAAQTAARRAGMSIGVVTDLAVGVHPTGAEVWTLGDALADGVTVGAPPDAFNQVGQDWSQPPWRPDRLAELGYAPYRAMLRTAFRHAGGLRIDHVMGLFRLWCIPAGNPPSQGAYLRYDHEAMVSILLLEAHRAGALVVGEDLGVVEPFVRDYLRERGVLGTSILWFEWENGAPKPPETYRELCLASVTTHDLPPTAGYLAKEHVHLREELGLLTRPVEEELAVAEREQEAFLAMARERRLLPEDATEQQTVEALHELLTRAPSRLLGVAVPDLVGDRRTQNQPGTNREYPNWRVPLSDPAGRPVLLDDLPANVRARSLAALLPSRESDPYV